MKNLSKLLIYLVIANFLTATIGIPIYVHICEKSGTSYYSSCKDCKHEEEQKNDCCGNPIYSSNNGLKISCCSDEVLLSKADITLSLEQVFELTKSEVVEIIFNLNNNDSENSNYLETESHNIPPPEFGKKLIIKKNELKIDLISC